MANMNEQYREMQHFHKELVSFNESLGQSFADVTKNHDEIPPIWTDEFRATYDKIWGPMREMMDRYLKSEGPRYVEFLQRKLGATRRYLTGG